MPKRNWQDDRTIIASISFTIKREAGGYFQVFFIGTNGESVSWHCKNDKDVLRQIKSRLRGI